MCRFFCRVNKEFARSQPTKAWVCSFPADILKIHCHRQSVSLGRWPVSRVFTNWDHSATDNCLWHPRWLDPQYLPILQMVRDSFDEFEVWSLNKSREGKKKCFHWKMHVEERSCALGRPPRMETHEQTEKGHWWVLSHFLFVPLVLIKRQEEDQPCQNNTGRIGLFCTGQGCPKQGLLDLWRNCRFIEISA